MTGPQIADGDGCGATVGEGDGAVAQEAGVVEAIVAREADGEPVVLWVGDGRGGGGGGPRRRDVLGVGLGYVALLQESREVGALLVPEGALRVEVVREERAVGRVHLRPRVFVVGADLVAVGVEEGGDFFSPFGEFRRGAKRGSGSDSR